MTIIVFLVDTSASMQQKAFVSGKSTLLDVAKGAVEFFVKLRQKSPESRGDRYMLLTFEEYPKNIKAGWKENLQTFMNELKNLEANGMTTMGSALKQVFDILNINRMQTGIDMYGQGRYPFYLEPAVIVVISDGGKLTTQASVQAELNLPMHSSVPGSELTREPFRWDQRLYALVLRMAGTPPTSQETTGHVASDYSPIDAMCEVTGGRSYAVTSQRVLHQCIDSLVQKLQSGVVIHFEKIGPDPPPPLPPQKDGGAGGGPNNGSDVQILDGGDSADGALSRADTVVLDDDDDDDNDEDDDDDEDTLNTKGLTFGGLASSGLKLDGAAGSSRPHTPTGGVTSILTASNVAWHSCRKLIYVPRSAQKGFAVGFWPLPEAFWPDMGAPSLPQRSAHPNVKFSCANQDAMIIDNLPFDKYELEPSPLTLYILARKQPRTCWQVFVQGSGSGGGGGGGLLGVAGAAKDHQLQLQQQQHYHPFGYLKASTNLLTVNLFVLPYNYPVLLPLLDDLFKVHRLKPTNEWRAQFQAYLRMTPQYYAAPLRRVLTRMGAGNLATSLIPETMDNCLSYTVLTYLKRLKNQAKAEYDKVLNSTSSSSSSGATAAAAAAAAGGPPGRVAGRPEGIRVVPRRPFKKELLTNNVLLKDRFGQLKDQLMDFPGFLLSVRDPVSATTAGSSGYGAATGSALAGAAGGGASSAASGPLGVGNGFRNPFHVPRKGLLDQIVRMRANYLQPCVAHTRLTDDDARHSLPIGQMGNYQDYLKKMPVRLREIESVPVRQHMFGNPFKINKNMVMDEVAENEEAPGLNQQQQQQQLQQLQQQQQQPQQHGGGGAVVGMLGSPQGAGGGQQLARGQKRPADSSLMPPHIKRAKKGPLPKDFMYRRTPPSTPTHVGSSAVSDEEFYLDLQQQQQQQQGGGPPGSAGPFALQNEAVQPAAAVAAAAPIGGYVTPPLSPNSFSEPRGGSSDVAAMVNGQQQQQASSNHQDTVVVVQSCPSLPMIHQMENSSAAANQGLPAGPAAAAAAPPPTMPHHHHHHQVVPFQTDHPMGGGGGGGTLNGGGVVLSASRSFQPAAPSPTTGDRPVVNGGGSGGGGTGYTSSNSTSLTGSWPAGSPNPVPSLPSAGEQWTPPSGGTVAAVPASGGGEPFGTGGHDGGGEAVVVVNLSEVKVKEERSKASETMTMTMTMTKDELRSVKLRNLNMKQIIFKEVKRPGRNHDRLFQMLRELHGPPQIRRDYIKDVIMEALRFKRETLADLLEKRMEELVSVPVPLVSAPASSAATLA